MEISVLMSCYNPIKKYFFKAIQSILHQSFNDYELIIVDDGNKEKILDILNELNISNNKIKVIRSENNIGLAKALNLGLKYCSGKYIARMDDDDISDKFRLEKQYEFLEQNKSYIGCWTAFNKIDENDVFISQFITEVHSCKFLKTLITKGNIFLHSSLFVKKEILLEIGGYDENLKYAQDSDLYIRILEKYNMGYLKEILLNFRVNKQRQNLYKDSFSSVCTFFGVYMFYLKNYRNIKYRIWFYQRIVRFVIFCLILYPKKFNDKKALGEKL